MENDEEKRDQEAEWLEMGVRDAKRAARMLSDADLLKMKTILDNRYETEWWRGNLPEEVRDQFEEFTEDNREGWKIYSEAWKDNFCRELERIREAKAKRKEPTSTSVYDWLR
jgi:hypothetical protein